MYVIWVYIFIVLFICGCIGGIMGLISGGGFCNFFWLDCGILIWGCKGGGCCWVCDIDGFRSGGGWFGIFK